LSYFCAQLLVLGLEYLKGIFVDFLQPTKLLKELVSFLKKFLYQEIIVG
jgi:hypothetical protein